MGRILKRVPLDFDYPLNTTWEGHCPSIEIFQKLFGEEYPFLYNYKHIREICKKCKKNFGKCSESADYCFWHNKSNKDKWYKEVPEGEGYQLWETTTEGSPISPVFKTLEELCEWCEKNATVFADTKVSKEEWFEILKSKKVHYKI